MDDENFKNMKDQKSKPGQEIKPDKEKPHQDKQNAARDGKTDRLRSWAKIIVDSTHACGTGDLGSWYTRKAIDRMIVEYCGIKPQNINHSLKKLVKGGYIERALKPASVMDAFVTRKEYLYRRTSKPYQERVKLVKLREGQIIKHNNKKLPKWFRHMLQF